MRGKFRTELKYGIFPAENPPRGISPPPRYLPQSHPLQTRISYPITQHQRYMCTGRIFLDTVPQNIIHKCIQIIKVSNVACRREAWSMGALGVTSECVEHCRRENGKQ